jgi:hypothetical protein
VMVVICLEVRKLTHQVACSPHLLPERTADNASS